MALINCPECSKEISDKVKACPNCGYPLNEEETLDSTPQQVEVTAINLKQKDSKKAKRLLLILSMIAIVAVIIFAVMNYAKGQELKESRNKYIDNLSLVSTTMLLGGGDAETLCNLIGSVWRNTIYEEKDSSTDKYTINKYGSFNSDFNISLATLFEDEKTISTIDSIKSNQELVGTLMKELNNPTEEFTKAYDTVSELYSAYQGLTDLAINPSGSLQSFSQSKSDKVDKFMEYYKKLETQIPEKEAE